MTIEDRLECITKSSDFKSWSKEDFSESFWIILAHYQKHPNRKDLNMLWTIFCWACHDDHGLSNSFRHALQWCKIDLNVESDREDLPEI